MLVPRLFLHFTTNFARNNRATVNLLNSIAQTKRFYSEKPFQPIVVEGVSPSVLPLKGKKKVVPRITLLSGNDVTVTTLDEAEKLSKRRDLKLVKIIDLDTKTQRPIYKLMTASEYHEEEVKNKKKKITGSSSIKGDKVLMLNAVISEHDLETQVKKIKKWLDKHFEVRVVVSGDADKSVSEFNRLRGFFLLNVSFCFNRKRCIDFWKVL